MKRYIIVGLLSSYLILHYSPSCQIFPLFRPCFQLFTMPPNFFFWTSLFIVSILFHRLYLFFPIRLLISATLHVLLVQHLQVTHISSLLKLVFTRSFRQVFLLSFVSNRLLLVSIRSGSSKHSWRLNCHSLNLCSNYGHT